MAEETTNTVVEDGIVFGSDKKVDENTEFELIDEGTYEVVLEKLEPKTSKNGKRYINITFVIRDDVEQNFKRRKIWYTIFSRDGDVAFNFNAINPLIITQEKRSDYKTRFKNEDEIFQYLIGLHMRLNIEIKFDEFRGKDGNVISDGSFQFSQWDIDHPVEESGSRNLEQINIADSDLPF